MRTPMPTRSVSGSQVAGTLPDWIKNDNGVLKCSPMVITGYSTTKASGASVLLVRYAGDHEGEYQPLDIDGGVAVPFGCLNTIVEIKLDGTTFDTGLTLFGE